MMSVQLARLALSAAKKWVQYVSLSPAAFGDYRAAYALQSAARFCSWHSG
jgi:hypothetical protein